jgi:hypothetical protein
LKRPHILPKPVEKGNIVGAASNQGLSKVNMTVDEARDD